MSIHAEQRIVHQLADRLRRSLADEVKAELCRKSSKVEKSNGTYGYGLENLWEEFKYQFREEHSDYVDRYEHLVRPLCRQVVLARGYEQRVLLWMVSRAFDDMTGQRDDVDLTDYDEHDAVEVVYGGLCELANNEPLIFDPGELRDEYPEGG